MTEICIVGEAWGEAEEEARRPFVGPSGRLLRLMLHQIGIEPRECFLTNVFNLRPKPKNDVVNLCGGKPEGIPGTGPLTKGKYVLAKYKPELDRLYEELRREKPNVIIALGGTAAWALLGVSGISKVRGYTAESSFGKVVPTYHPAAVLRDWTLRPITMTDLNKAKREATFPEYRRPSRRIFIEPSLADMYAFEQEHITPSPELSIDIETKADQMTCIGFAPTPDVALVVPFYTPDRPDGNYWRTIEEEIEALAWVRHICSLRKRITGQNFVYDMSFLWRSYRIPVPHAAEDTMLLHHALQPEMEKGLGFLASIYTDEAAWKFMGRQQVATRRSE